MYWTQKIVRVAPLSLLLGALPCAAQLAPSPSDALARIQANAAASAQACTVEATSPCAQANPKIIAAAQASTTLDANLRALAIDIGGRVTGSSAMARATDWAVAAFKAAGVDEVHVEPYSVPPVWADGGTRPGMLLAVTKGTNVVAEIRGREKPDEYVVLSSHLDSWDIGSGAIDAGGDVATVIEAARAIHLTGLRPRRSIRFILFTGHEQGGLGAWGYGQSHRAELGRIAGAISLDGGAGRIVGFALAGRMEFEPAIREVLHVFDASAGVMKYTADADLRSDAFDFLLEGVPSLQLLRDGAEFAAIRHTAADTYDKIDVSTLKHNTAIAGVLAFGLAERETPLGPRLSRTETGAILDRNGLAKSMRDARLWPLWQSVIRGRLP